MIRLRVIGVLLILCGVTLSVLAQDSNLVVTNVAEQATQEATDAPDPFERTSTALVAGATQTGAAASPRAVITVNAQQADVTPTQTASSPTPITPAAIGGSEESVLIATLMIFGVFMMALVILGAVVIRVRSSNEESST